MSLHGTSVSVVPGDLGYPRARDRPHRARPGTVARSAVAEPAARDGDRRCSRCWLLATAAHNGLSPLVTGVRVVEPAVVGLAALALLDSEDRLAALVDLLLAVTLVADVMGVYDYIAQGGGRVDAFLGTHDFSALATMPLLVVLAGLFAPGRWDLPNAVGRGRRRLARADADRRAREPRLPVPRRHRPVRARLAPPAPRPPAGRPDAADRRRRRRLDPVAAPQRPGLRLQVRRQEGDQQGPVRIELEPAPDLRLRRRPHLPRPAAHRDRLVGRPASVDLRQVRPGGPAEVPRQPAAVLPEDRPPVHPAAGLRRGAVRARPRRRGAAPGGLRRRRPYRPRGPLRARQGRRSTTCPPSGSRACSAPSPGRVCSAAFR